MLRIFQALDTNGDGVITKDELIQGNLVSIKFAIGYKEIL